MLSYRQRNKMDGQRTWLNSIVANVQAKEWYGTFTIKFQGGYITLVRKETNLTPPTNTVRPEASRTKMKS